VQPQPLGEGFKTVPVHELLPETIDVRLSRLAVGPTTKRHSLKAMRVALKRGVTWGYLPSNPAEAVEMPPEADYDAPTRSRTVRKCDAQPPPSATRTIERSSSSPARPACVHRNGRLSDGAT
jgi:hypothetical protein